MDKIILIYRTDKQYSYQSREVIGIATSFGSAIDILKIESENYDEKELTDEQVKMLKDNSKTAGYKDDAEFYISYKELDTRF
jgi:hypothetical protein